MFFRPGTTRIPFRANEQKRKVGRRLQRIELDLTSDRHARAAVEAYADSCAVDMPWLAELLRDSVTLLPPFDAAAVAAAIQRLRVARLLGGFRGRPAGDVPALVETALACARYAQANLDTLAELDINPVIVRPAGSGAVAVDALIRLTE